MSVTEFAPGDLATDRAFTVDLCDASLVIIVATPADDRMVVIDSCPRYPARMAQYSTLILNRVCTHE